MANDTNIFKNSLTSAEYVTPERWSEEIEQVAREANLFRGMTNSVLTMNRVGTPGNTEYIAKNSALSAVDVVDGDSVPIQAISFNQISVTASIKAAATQVTLKQLRDQLPTVRADIIQNLGLALAEKEESDLISKANETTSDVIYPGGKDASTIEATDTFTPSLFNKALVEMRGDKRRGRNLVIHPAVEGHLREDDQFVDASKLGDDRVNRTGMIGTYFGVNVWVTTNVTEDEEGDGEDVTVYNNLLLGDRALVLMDKMRPTFDIDRNLIENLSVTMVVHADYGVSVLNDESIRVVKSAKGE